jgi:hypothetical protein
LKVSRKKMIKDKKITVEKERTRRVDRPDVLPGNIDTRVVLEGVSRGSGALEDVGALIIEGAVGARRAIHVPNVMDSMQLRSPWRKRASALSASESASWSLLCKSNETKEEARSVPLTIRSGQSARAEHETGRGRLHRPKEET